MPKQTNIRIIGTAFKFKVQHVQTVVLESLATHSAMILFARAGGQAVANVPKVVFFCVEHSFEIAFV